MKKTNINQSNVNGYNFATDTININNTISHRHLNDKMIAQLTDTINKETNIKITAVLGNNEAFEFATEVMEYLKNAGYKVNGVSQAIFASRIKGQIIEQDPKAENNVRIIIGENPL